MVSSMIAVRRLRLFAKYFFSLERFPLFPLSLAFSLIVAYDAAGVRRHAGKQAEVLNRILADVFHGSPISDTKLKEVLGHSPLQVTCGAVVGILVGSFYMLRFA